MCAALAVLYKRDALRRGGAKSKHVDPRQTSLNGREEEAGIIRQKRRVAGARDAYHSNIPDHRPNKSLVIFPIPLSVIYRAFVDPKDEEGFTVPNTSV